MTADPKDQNDMASDDHDLLVGLNKMVEIMMRDIKAFGDSVTQLRADHTKGMERLAVVETKVETSKELPKWVPILAMVISGLALLLTAIATFWPHK